MQALLRLKTANSNSCRLVGETLKNMSCEFSRPHDLRELAEAPHSIELIAADAECKSLAIRFGQQSIRNLRASLTLAWLIREKVLVVSGSFGAEVVQTCVVSLEPVRSIVEEEINLVFARDAEVSCDVADLEDAEPLVGEIIDLGEIIAGEFSLSLDPYPRREDIDVAEIDLGPGVSLLSEGEAEKRLDGRKPFNVLASLKSKH